MRRGARIAIMLTGWGAIAVPAAFDPAPRLIWNASASAPIGLYSIDPGRRPQADELTAVMPPPRLAQWMAQRHYLPVGVPLLKHVAAGSGQTVCRVRRSVSIDGVAVADVLEHDRRGRALPVWQGCHRLRLSEVFLLNPSVPDSFDSRYFGPLPAGSVIGPATPLYTRTAPGKPFVWGSAAKPRAESAPIERSDHVFD